MNSIWIIFCTVFLVSVNSQKRDSTLDPDTGTVSLKASSDPSLCVTAIPYNSEKSKAFLQLIQCSQEFSEYEGDKRFDLDAISDGVYRFSTDIFSKDEEYYLDACFYAGYNENSIALTDKCERSNPWQYWTFPEITPGKYQLKHKQTAKCMRSPKISNGTTLIAADCDVNDKNQIWEGEFLKQDWKWKHDGRIVLKPISDEALCMRPGPNDEKFSRINLVSCERGHGALKIVEIIELGKVPDGHYQLGCYHVPPGSTSLSHACMWAGKSGGSAIGQLVLTDRCNYNNPWQHWKFIEISEGRVQLMHKPTGKCLTASKDKSKVLTADCSHSDYYQIWIREYM